MVTKLQRMVENIEDRHTGELVGASNRWKHLGQSRGSVLSASVDEMKPVWKLVRLMNGGCRLTKKVSNKEWKEWFANASNN